MAAPASQQSNAQQPNMRALLARVTRDQGPEFEQSLAFTPLTVQSTPTSVRTDRKIKFFDLVVRLRLTNGGVAPTLRTAPPLLGTQVFGLIQQVTVRGQHLRYGAQTPFQMRGETIAELLALTIPNYVPQFTVNGVRGGALSTVAAATNDVEFVLPIPMIPLDVAPGDMAFYALHGPDWPGNLYIDVQCNDGTAVATANPPTVGIFGGGAGSGLIEIHSERPLVGKEFMARIRPAVTFHVQNFSQPTATVASGGGTGVKLADLVVGKDTTRIFLKTGTQAAGSSAGVVVYGSLLDTVVTRFFFSLDNRQLRFQTRDAVLQDYMARTYGRTIPVGYKILDFVSNPGTGPANPKASFPSSKLTAARQYQANGDVTSAAGQIAEVVQEMVLGAPGIQ